MDRAQADYMGMLATVMNALAMQSALEAKGLTVTPSRDGIVVDRRPSLALAACALHAGESARLRCERTG